MLLEALSAFLLLSHVTSGYPAKETPGIKATATKNEVDKNSKAVDENAMKRQWFGYPYPPFWGPGTGGPASPFYIPVIIVTNSNVKGSLS